MPLPEWRVAPGLTPYPEALATMEALASVEALASLPLPVQPLWSSRCSPGGGWSSG